MLDRDHPMTEHIFAASGTDDAILEVAKRMTVASRLERVRLLQACGRAFATLRRLASEHFTNRPALAPAIDALERALERLAGMPDVPAEGPPAAYTCPACGAALERRSMFGLLAPDDPTDIYCSPCLNLIMPSLSVLRSGEGFGTDFI